MKTSKKAILTAAVFAGILNMNGCVYGPPADGMFSEDGTSLHSFDPSRNETPDVYGPPLTEGTEEFDPSENEMQAAYGPPPVPEISETAGSEEQP